MNDILDDQIETNMSISTSLLYEWEETRKWTNFLSILGIISLAFMLLGVFSMMTLGSSFSNEMPIGIGFISFIYVLIIAFAGIPIYFLYKFSSLMKKGIRSKSLEIITEAFSNLRKLYKFIGILTLIGLSINVLTWLGMLAFGASFL